MRLRLQPSILAAFVLLTIVPGVTHAQFIPDYILFGRCVATMDEMEPLRNGQWQTGFAFVAIQDQATGTGGWTERHSFDFTAYAYTNGPNGYAEYGTGDDVCIGVIENLPGTSSYNVVSTAPNAASGSRSLTDSPSGNYSSNRNISATINQSFDLSGATDIELLYFHHHAFDWRFSGDRGYVEVNTGSGWTIVDPEMTPTANHYRYYYGDDHQLKRGTVNLSQFAGESNVQIRFRFQSNSSATDDGWYVDDVRLLADGNTLFFDDLESGTGAWTLTSPWGLSTDANYTASLGIVDATGLYSVTPITSPASVGEGMGFNAVEAYYELDGVERRAYAKVYHTAPQYVAPPDMGEEDVCSNTVAVENAAAPIHERLFLNQNHPNPFNPSTQITFKLAADGPANLQIYDESGRLVRTVLSAAALPAGEHQFTWDGRDQDGIMQGSGIYLYKLEAGGQTVSRKMVMVR